MFIHFISKKERVWAVKYKKKMWLKKCGAHRMGLFLYLFFFELRTPQTLFPPSFKKIEQSRFPHFLRILLLSAIGNNSWHEILSHLYRNLNWLPLSFFFYTYLQFWMTNQSCVIAQQSFLNSTCKFQIYPI
jgi:hypothetical protein